MNITKILSHKITNHARIFDAMLDIYIAALSYVVEVIEKECGNLEAYTTKSIVQLVEKLIHRTKSNPLSKYLSFNE